MFYYNNRDISQNTTKSNWGWVGTGPPGSYQLKSGRIITPAYHAFMNKLDGLLTKNYLIISDDFGQTFYIGA